MNVTLLASGSPDPRHERGIRSVAARMKLAGIPTEAAFLEHSAATPAAIARKLWASGQTSTVIVPMATGSGFRTRADLGAAIRAMTTGAPELNIHQAQPLGIHPLLMSAAAELITASGLAPGPDCGVIIAGSGDSRGFAALDALVRLQGPALAATLGVRAVRTAHVDGGRPLGRVRALLTHVDGCTSAVAVPALVSDGILRDHLATYAARVDLPLIPGALCDTQALADLTRLRAQSAFAQIRPALLDLTAAPVG